MLLTTILFLLAAALVEIFARYFEVRARKGSIISTLPHTAYAPSKLIQISTVATLLGVVCIITASPYITSDVLFQLSILAIFCVVRATLVGFVITIAKLSEPIRYLEMGQRKELTSSRFMFHFSGPHMLDPYHVTMWLPAIEKTGEHLVVFVREQKHLKAFFDMPTVVAIYAQGTKNILALKPDSASVMFHANNSMKNAEMIKKLPHITHVQLLHGDSDKPPSFHPTAVMYDRLFVSGQMAIDRYAQNNVSIPKNKFNIVGRPQLDYVSKPHKSAYDLTIVYMTTWAGTFEDSDFSSLFMSDKIVGELLKLKTGLKTQIIFKPHPVSYKDPNWGKVKKKIKKLATKNGDNHDFYLAKHNVNPFELYAKADILVSDISSTIIDFLYSGKPYLVTNPHGLTRVQLEKYPSAKAGYLIENDASNLLNLVEKVLSDDFMIAEREDLRRHAFGDYGQPPGSVFVEECQKLLECKRSA